MSAPVCVIGLDAMDSGIAHALMADGRMPNLAAFVESSAWAPTDNPRGMLVGGVWPAITTGCWPDHAGFYCDLQIVPGTYEARRRDPNVISVPHVWDVLAAAGRRCAVLDVPVSKLSERDDVVQLAEWGTHDRLLPPGSAPPSLVDEVIREFGDYPVQPKCDQYAQRGDRRGLLAALEAGVATKERLASAFLERGPWDFVAVVFSESHCTGHQFWSLHDQADPAYDAAQRAELGDPLHRMYQVLDGALGRLLDQIGDDATTVVVLSHGMGRHDDADHLLSEILRRLDVADDGARHLVTWRERGYRLLQRRGRAARRARPLVGERRFFKVPNNELNAGIRINVKGREPRGRVESGAEVDALIAQLHDDLLAIENVDSGAPLIRDVWRTDDVYDGPKRDELPDLFVEWNRGTPMREARSPKIGTVSGVTSSVRSGDHRPNGLFAMRAPDVVPRRLEASVRAIDVAPTIAARLGVSMPSAQGAPVTDLVRRASSSRPNHPG